jgi:hypothetical protein
MSSRASLSFGCLRRPKALLITARGASKMAAQPLLLIEAASLAPNGAVLHTFHHFYDFSLVLVVFFFSQFRERSRFLMFDFEKECSFPPSHECAQV